MVQRPEREDYEIYQGSYFTIEYYYNEAGKMPGRGYFNGLPLSLQVKSMALFARLAEVGRIFDQIKFRFLKGTKSIYEFKPQPSRFFCFFAAGRKVIVTDGYTKQSDKTPRSFLERAERSKTDYEERVRKGDYYS